MIDQIVGMYTLVLEDTVQYASREYGINLRFTNHWDQ
jgi:hypothetical protein